MTFKRNTVSYGQQLQMVVRQYREFGCSWPASARQIAEWGMENGLLSYHPDSVVRRFAEDISTAMREEYITDGKGRSVRSKHAARYQKNGQQIVLWADIRSASPEHMKTAFQQRRQQIVGDCRQLKLDVDSYNENANPGPAIQLVLDFSDDVAEYEIMEGLRS